MNPIRLSRELETTADVIRSAISSEDGPVNVGRIQHALLQLGHLIRLAEILERELDVYRIDEVGKAARAVASELATEALASGILDREKIVRPDFGRRS